MNAANAAASVGWLVANFVDTTAGVEQAVAVSSDGLVLARSDGLDRADADRLAAIVCGLRSLADGAARVMDCGGVEQVVVEMDRGFLLVATVAEGSILGVVSARDSDLGLVGYETAVLVQRVGAHLTPELVAELKGVGEQ